MHTVRSLKQVLRGLIQKHGSESLKKTLWNRDYSHGRYGYGDTTGDFLYPFLAEHAHKGAILDLGCGEGKTANELPSEAYAELVGVDISDLAIAKAKAGAERCGRCAKNSFYSSDIENFVPLRQFDIILFRDSLYYVPQPMMTLKRYADFLEENGCFVVRMCEGTGRRAPIVEAIEANFSVVGKRLSEAGDVAIAFRPLRKG